MLVTSDRETKTYYLVREWGHLSVTHVTEEDYMALFERIRQPYYYENRVRDEYGTCKYYQNISVSFQ